MDFNKVKVLLNFYNKFYSKARKTYAKTAL